MRETEYRGFHAAESVFLINNQSQIIKCGFNSFKEQLLLTQRNACL